MLAGQTHVLQQGLCSKLIVSSVPRKRAYHMASITAMSPLACPVGQDMHMALLLEEVAIRFGLRGEGSGLALSWQIVLALLEAVLKYRGERRALISKGMI